MDLLGVQHLGERRKVGHIGEEDGDQLALPFQSGLGSKDLVGQVLGGVRDGMGGVEGRRLGQLMAAISTELISGKIFGAAARTDECKLISALPAELPGIGIFRLTLGAFHLFSPH